MHTQGAAAAIGEDLEISAGLCRLHYAEGVFLAGNRYVVGVVAGDLEEYTAVGSAFVGLTGRVQKTRAEAEACRDVLGVADCMTNFLQLRFMGFVHLNVAQHGKVIAVSDA